MQYKPLGRTGVKVSEICLGAMMFGGRTAHEDAVAIIDAAIDRGINFIDTANVYNQGLSEEAVGDALKRRGRDRIVLATKVHGNMDAEDPNGNGNSRRHIIQQCEASLRRLQTDWIDLYQIHRPQSDIPIDETLRALDDLVRDGKVRYVGTSTFAAYQLVESFWVSEKQNLARFVCEQPPYNLLDRRIERELVPVAQQYGMALIPWSPLGGGLLTGKYRRGEPLPEDGRFTLSTAPMHRRRMNERVYDLLDALDPMAKGKGCTMSQLALAWTLQQPGITSPIIGPRTMEQFEDNMGALGVEFSDEDLTIIDNVAPPGEACSPFYEGDWAPPQYR